MRKYLIALFFMCLFASVNEVSAQCSMCTANAEQGAKNGNTQTLGINNGVLYLLSIPFILVTGVGLLWYTKFRIQKA